eukprot:379571-Prymnesium_polylepis.1
MGLQRPGSGLQRLGRCSAAPPPPTTAITSVWRHCPAQYRRGPVGGRGSIKHITAKRGRAEASPG